MVDYVEPVFGNSTTGYAHTLENFKQDLASAKASFSSTLQKLNSRNGTSLIVSISYAEEPTYAQFYNTYSGVEPPAGALSILGGRFLDQKDLSSNRANLVEALNNSAGTPGQYTVNEAELLGGKTSRIAADGDPNTASLPISGLNPAWRSAVVHQIVARGWTDDTPQSVIDDIRHDVTYVKEAAWRRFAPRTGAYMNENSQFNQDWQQDFYGTHYRRLAAIKSKYDPDGVFYCQTCVGSDMWEQTRTGKLCLQSR